MQNLKKKNINKNNKKLNIDGWNSLALLKICLLLRLLRGLSNSKEKRPS